MNFLYFYILIIKKHSPHVMTLKNQELSTTEMTTKLKSGKVI
jgi:hypothetical protein